MTTTTRAEWNKLYSDYNRIGRPVDVLKAENSSKPLHLLGASSSSSSFELRHEYCMTMNDLSAVFFVEGGGDCGYVRDPNNKLCNIHVEEKEEEEEFKCLFFYTVLHC